MTRTRLLLFVPAVLLLAATFAPALAADDPFGGRWWTRPRVVERLGLSESQVQQIERISYEHQDRILELRAELARANLALGRLLEAEKIDDKALADAIDRVVEARCALARSELESRAAVARVLELPQRRMLADLRRSVERMREQRTPPPRRRRLR
ncbi:MAG: hypothetical protein Kow0062_10340 [Acidobacteriota bacterium]